MLRATPWAATADILVVRGDPHFDITALANVEVVVKGGRVVERVR